MTPLDIDTELMFALAVEDTGVDEALPELERLVSGHGAQRAPQADLGPAANFEELSADHGVKPRFLSAFRPQANGSLERQHGSLKERLRWLLADELEQAPDAVHAPNTRISSSRRDDLFCDRASAGVTTTPRTGAIEERRSEAGEAGFGGLVLRALALERAPGVPGDAGERVLLYVHHAQGLEARVRGPRLFTEDGTEYAFVEKDGEWVWYTLEEELEEDRLAARRSSGRVVATAAEPSVTG